MRESLELPGGRGLIRWMAVATLLALAAAVVYAGGGQAPCPRTPGAGASPAPPPFVARPPGTASPPESLPPESSTLPGATLPDSSKLPGATSDPGGVRLPAGMVGLPVRLADPAAAAIVRPGWRVDLVPHTTGPPPTGPPPNGPPRTGTAPTGPPIGTPLIDVLVLAVLAGGSFDEPGAAALLVAVPDNRSQPGRYDTFGATFTVIVRSSGSG